MLAVILQTSIFPLCFSSGNIPDLVLILLISGVAVLGFQSIWIWIIISGIILDLFSFRAVGVNVISFIIFSYAVSFFSRRLILGEKIGGVLTSGFFVVFMTFFHNLWIQSANSDFELEKIWKVLASFGLDFGFKTILNIILFFIFILLFKKIKRNSSRSSNLFSEK